MGKQAVHLGGAAWILPLYFLISLLIGWFVRSSRRTSGDYLNATRSLPFWVVAASYLASNCSALETTGLSAMAAQYGAQAFHFYWIGAIPAMIVLALWVMPIYRRSNVSSVPEFLRLRYGPRMRLLNACVTAIILLLLGGINLYAMAQVLLVTMNLRFDWGIVVCAAVVLTYALLGGIRATIYNEVFQLIVMIAGLLPLAFFSRRLYALPSATDLPARLHLWRFTPVASPHASMDLLGVIVGLGFVLSFGYWCTDFVLMQRAFAARTEDDARRVPLWAGFGKLGFSLVVVIPGLAASQVLPSLHGRYDQALPALMTRLYGPGMLGLGLTALAASLMSGFAANISAFAAIWTRDIYRTTLRPGKSDQHYLAVGRISLIVAAIVCLTTSYLNFYFSDMMEHIQLIFSVFGAPLWAIFLLGVLTRRTDERGAIIGFLAGSGLGFAHFIASAAGLLHYGSTMSSNFYAAIYSFSMAFVLGWLLSRPHGTHMEAASSAPQGSGLPRIVIRQIPVSTGLWILSATLLAACIALNAIWN